MADSKRNARGRAMFPPVLAEKYAGGGENAAGRAARFPFGPPQGKVWRAAGDRRECPALSSPFPRFARERCADGGCFAVSLARRRRIWYNTGMQNYRQLVCEGETGEKFAAFYALLTEYNEKFNLTRITGEEDCRIKHFYDSLLGEKFFPVGARCAEVGSGGGFPSVPLLIARADLSFLLIESVGKKCGFLEHVVRVLGLNATVVHARAEELARLSDYREKFDVCCARAVARLNTLAEYCAPFVRVGGRMIAYKGDAAEEIAEAERAFRTLGVRTIAAERQELPGGAGTRTVVVAEKWQKTPAAYPRGRGRERSRPL